MLSDKNLIAYKPTISSRIIRRKKPITCIIGMKCVDGVVIAGDRRVLRGTEYSEEAKISEPFPDFVVGASGVSGLMDKFLYEMNVFLQSDNAKGIDWRGFLYVLEDLAFGLFDRYKERLEVDEQVEVGAYYFDVLFGCKPIVNVAKLYHLYRNGFSQEVKRFDIIGHGQPHALPFIKALYNEKRTMSEMVKISAFTLKLIDEANVDLSVGGEPQIFTIPNEGKAKELFRKEINNLLGTLSPTQILESILKT